MKVLTSVACSVLVLGSVVGCGGGNSRSTVAVSGKVSLKGQPLASATLFFIDPTTGAASVAPVAAGEFQAQLEPGKYRVAVQPAADQIMDDRGLIVKTKPEMAIPPKYQSDGDSGLALTVENSAVPPVEFVLE